MLIDLEKQDLINLVKGVSLSFTAMSEPYIKGCGYYDDKVNKQIISYNIEQGKREDC